MDQVEGVMVTQSRKAAAAESSSGIRQSNTLQPHLHLPEEHTAAGNTEFKEPDRLTGCRLCHLFAV